MSSEPGVYFLGLPWQSRRGSSFIWGVWHDAKYLADHIQMQRGYLAYGAAEITSSEGDVVKDIEKKASTLSDAIVSGER